MTSPSFATALTPLALAISLVVISQDSVAQSSLNTPSSTQSPASKNNQQEEIESITVVGQTTNTQITPEELEKFQSNDLADIFRSIPSVSVGGSLGIAQKVYIRGLEDTLLNITVDGAPQTGTLFHHIGRVSIEPELLKEVEVQSGAGEATSGAGAIGGAIRFKTKDIDDLLDRDQTFGGIVKTGYFSNDGYKTSGTVYGRINPYWGILGSYVHVDRDNMQDGDGKELFGTAAKQNLAFVKINGQLSRHQHLSLSYEVRQEDGDFGARPNWPTLENDTLFPMEGQRKTLVINHHYASGPLLNLETTLFHTQSDIEQNRFDRWGLYGGNMKTVGFDIRNISQLNQHTLTYGIEYRKDTVSSEYLAAPGVWQKWAYDPTQGQFEQQGTVSGLYLQDHWQVNQQLLLSAGLRLDQYKLTEVTYGRKKTNSNGVSPNLGMEYAFNDHWQLNLGYAQAIRGKEVGDAFTLEQAADATTIAPSLKAEEVNNTELGLSYQDQQWHLSATAYQSDIDNVILDQLGRGVLYENVGTLETDGFEVKARYWHQDLTLTASYSHNNAKLNGDTVEGYEHIGLANGRGNTWGLTLNYLISSTLEAGWNASYTQSLNNIEVLQRAVAIGWIDSTRTISKPGYQTHDVYLQWQPEAVPSFTFNLAIQNLFDKSYRDHSSVGSYAHIKGWESVAGLKEAGRDIRVSLSYAF